MSFNISNMRNVLEGSNVSFNIDENPTPEKISRIKEIMARKASIIDNSMQFYKTVFRIK